MLSIRGQLAGEQNRQFVERYFWLGFTRSTDFWKSRLNCRNSQGSVTYVAESRPQSAGQASIVLSLTYTTLTQAHLIWFLAKAGKIQLWLKTRTIRQRALRIIIDPQRFFAATASTIELGLACLHWRGSPHLNPVCLI